MKHVMATLAGEPAIGDYLAILCTTPAGGQSGGDHRVQEGDTLEHIAATLAWNFTAVLPEAFSAKANGTSILITIHDLPSVEGATIYSSVQGKGTATIDIKDW